MRRCTCWDCRRRAGLARIAPTLTAAYFADVALRPLRSRRRTELLQAERLLAHRELQLLRAGRHRNRRYLNERQRKLEAARRILESARKHMAEAR